MLHESKLQTSETERTGSTPRPDVDNPLPGMTMTLHEEVGQTFVTAKRGSHETCFLLNHETDESRISAAIELEPHYTASSIMTMLTSANSTYREAAKKEVRRLKTLGREIYAYARSVVEASEK